jgi:hypothetical protein
VIAEIAAQQADNLIMHASSMNAMRHGQWLQVLAGDR